MKYTGTLQIQIFNFETGCYVPYPFLPADAAVAREVAGRLPWRVAKADRPLTPAMKNHFHCYIYDEPNLGKS